MTVNSEWLKKLPINNIISITPVSGGDINEAYCVKTDHKKYFMKVQPGRGKAFFAHEVEGLKLLSQAALTPKVIKYGQINNDGYLILNWINFGSGSQYQLGQTVAKVHKIHSRKFGLDHDFKLGKIPKINKWQSNWVKFYINQRLDPLVKLAKQNHVWNSFREKHYRNLRFSFVNYYSNPHHKVVPSLLHGDLWFGNVDFTADGKPMLIDPDVFFGDREMDLAMTTVFGGFTSQFYQGYNSVYPIKPGFKNRLPWYQFNYLMAHLNLFGEAYGIGVDNILNRY